MRSLLEKTFIQFRASIRERIGSIIDWSRRHPVRFFVYGACLIVVLEYLSLPNIRLQELDRVNPHRTALMQQREREATAAGKSFHVQQFWVPL